MVGRSARFRVDLKENDKMPLKSCDIAKMPLHHINCVEFNFREEISQNSTTTKSLNVMIVVSFERA